MRTEEHLRVITDALQQNCGDMHAACRSAGLSPFFVTTWCRDDPETARAIDEAQRVGWLGLESEAIRRGVHGVNEDVYYKGEVVGYKTNYSDTLLGKLLEARAPAFKKGEAANNVFNGPTQINLMPRAETYEDWLAMKDKTLERRAHREAVPAPLDAALQLPDILVGEFVEVRNPLEGLGI